MNLFWFLNQNHKLQFEKWICWQNIFLYMTVTHIWMQKKTKTTQNSRLGFCARLLNLNQLIFLWSKLKERRISLVRIIFCAYQIYTFSRVYVWEESYVLPTFQIYIRFLCLTTYILQRRIQDRRARRPPPPPFKKKTGFFF